MLCEHVSKCLLESVNHSLRCLMYYSMAFQKHGKDILDSIKIVKIKPFLALATCLSNLCQYMPVGFKAVL